MHVYEVYAAFWRNFLSSWKWLFFSSLLLVFVVETPGSDQWSKQTLKKKKKKQFIIWFTHVTWKNIPKLMTRASGGGMTWFSFGPPSSHSVLAVCCCICVDIYRLFFRGNLIYLLADPHWPCQDLSVRLVFLRSCTDWSRKYSQRGEKKKKTSDLPFFFLFNEGKLSHRWKQHFDWAALETDADSLCLVFCQRSRNITCFMENATMQAFYNLHLWYVILSQAY